MANASVAEMQQQCINHEGQLPAGGAQDLTPTSLWFQALRHLMLHAVY
jgi:hypothetical protein